MGNPSTSLTDKNFSLPLGFCQKRFIKVHGHWRNSLSLDGQKVFSVFDMVYQDFNPFDDAPAFEPTVLSVTALNRRVAQLLQSEFGSIWVRGEIRGFMQAASGHWYFTLKDEGAEVRCAMFAGSNRRLGFYPKTGDKVEVRARVSLYQPRGDYQLVVEGMRRAGLGNLYEQFLRLKEKLQREGLFDSDRKKPIPKMAMRIGVVTSLQAAALRDVITTLSRRAPYAQIVIYPSSVQGDEAPFELIEALRAAEQRQEVDVLLLVRGGGSLQDLWAFNDEGVARQLALMSIPVIAGVGHESDTTIADWVADCRAATPTAAAEMATVDVAVLLRHQATLSDYLSQMFDRRYQTLAQRLDWAQSQLRTPQELLARENARLIAADRALHDAMAMSLAKQQERLRLAEQARRHVEPDCSHDMIERLKTQLNTLWSQRLQLEKARLGQLQVVLQETDPKALLQRGYSMVTDEKGRVIQSVMNLQAGDAITIVMSDGLIESDVKRIEKTH